MGWYFFKYRRRIRPHLPIGRSDGSVSFSSGIQSVANAGIGEPVHVSFLLMMFSQIAERFGTVALRGADVGN